MNDLVKLAKTKYNIVLEENRQLAPLTTWKIGGPARYFFSAKTPGEIGAAIRLCNQEKMPYYILGGGSNLLVSDAGFEGLVIKLEILKMEVQNDKIIVGAGETMGKVAAISMQNNLSGIEWAVGIPGTVGGALFGNSNCFGGSTGESVRKATLLGRDGEIKTVEKDYFQFDYNYSKLQDTKEIALEVVFGLKKITKEEMNLNRGRIVETAVERSQKQPLGAKVAGSTFKALKQTKDNIQKLDDKYPRWRESALRDGFISTGFIIDKCLGLKGYKLDKMRISEVHSNFFENLGEATAENAKKLIDFVKKECKNKLDINLEEEIKYVGKFK
ncbi:MAG: UDP-N-acetylenolpyruvoylglucosamine reductase [Candidatus Doudnabacteria bacterium CG10_big_fil_rev_8_21_14_0_10_41_10]|uniref:UDP-N-acetylenolpyruvoylglucosamine reductase n=1 Tax=Candidatus Doudnabacteria bacterium CG10_big_fil_rev_8_21_14_0_10_41_10 TaxID=1974551 RepID=A0A2H0VD10_9BACT|nr:MAG: UDP-N-acetylenolpyruvoylglucosamine reductase [Candidatus Doudnabacteria bacterium CG10_big_fil_rev_8_21_14_0_10_41_10]